MFSNTFTDFQKITGKYYAPGVHAMTAGLQLLSKRGKKQQTNKKKGSISYELSSK